VAALQAKQGGYGNVARAKMACGGRVGYAEGGEVPEEEPSLAKRAMKWWETSTDEAREALVGSVADALPDVLGGKLRKKGLSRVAQIDAATKGE
jgi:hypothetical protein